MPLFFVEKLLNKQVSCTKQAINFNHNAFFLLLHIICNIIYLVRFIIASEFNEKEKEIESMEKISESDFFLTWTLCFDCYRLNHFISSICK